MMAELRDSAGSPITHAPVPPPVDFPYPNSALQDSSTSSATSLPKVDASRKSLDSSETARPRASNVSVDLPRAKGLQRMETAPAAQSTRPLQQRAATERPQVVTRNSIIGSKRRPVFRPVPRSNVATSYRFDYYSESDTDASTDSSDDEPESTENKTAEQVNLEQTATNRSKFKRKKFFDPYSKFSVGNEQYRTKGRVSNKDGRLKISIKDFQDGYLAQTLSAGLKRHFKHAQSSTAEAAQAVQKASLANQKPIPRMNVVIMVIGSRGDIQPFIKIGKILKEEYGHCVRIATHPAFKKFVEKDSGLEFFSVGGDPSELMAFMVKNPGLIPSVDTIRQGEIGRRRAQMFEMFQGMWRACINATDDETDKANLKMMGARSPFVADVIIANPPSFAHVHIAERLGIPVHMMFTFPYSPTTQFPHPLANIRRSNVDANYTNFMSYPLVDMMTWQGLGDLVNKFREKTLGLEPVSKLWAPGSLYRQKVPHTYMWSPGLVPKPSDWGPEIDVTGFVFLELASSFKPPEELAKFLDAGPPPIYIGFGSIVVDDPEEFTRMIFEAVEKAGVRALVNKGWGGLGGNGDAPDNIYMLGNTPHDWLFPRVQAVVHHGGAGTTAIGLKLARPTMIVPFFGDQPFWGAMVATAKAGAHKCIPYKQLTADKLAEGIKQCLTEEAKKNAQAIADSIEKEGDGAANAVTSFHRSLQLRGDRSMRCSILDERVAVWHVKSTKLRLSALAADILIDRGKLKWADLRLLRHNEWNDFGGPGEPITGGGSAVLNTVVDATKGVGSIPVNMARKIKKREEHEKKKKNLQQKQQEKPKQANIAAAETNATQALQARPQAQREDTDPFLHRRPQGLQREPTTLSKLSADPPDNIADVIGDELGHGFSETGRAIAKGPMNLSLAVAQGFHNAPRLYGDSTVRPIGRISGFQSGLRAGRNEFLYGIYDAWTGLVTQPYHGVKEDGALGLVRGVGMGIGGFVLKNISALMGPGAFAAKGVHKEIQKARQPTNVLRRARILQGHNERLSMSQHDVEDAETTVLHGWDIVVDVLKLGQEQVEGNKKHRVSLNLHSRKDWNEAAAVESVELAERKMHAKRLSMSLEQFDKIKQTPRKSAESKARFSADRNHRTRSESMSSVGNKARYDLATKQDKAKEKPLDKQAEDSDTTLRADNTDGTHETHLTGKDVSSSRSKSGTDTTDFAGRLPVIVDKPLYPVQTIS